MKHKHQHGLGCSCCSPLWKHLIPSSQLGSVTKPTKSDKCATETQFRIFTSKPKPGCHANPDCPASIQTLAGGKNVEVEAIGIDINSGLIIATGSLDDVKADIPADIPEHIEVHYLKDGHTLLPGLIEPHVHILSSAWLNASVKIEPFDGQQLRKDYDQQWVLNKLSNSLPTTPDTWLIAAGVDPSLFIKGPHEFDANILDSVSTTVPLFVLNASMHTAYLNTAALKKYQGQKQHFDENGILQEAEEIMAFIENAAGFPAIDKNEINCGVDAIFKSASELEVTYMHDAAIQVDDNTQVQYLQHKANEPGRKVRLGGALIVMDTKDLDQIIKNYHPSDYEPSDPDRRLNLSFIKLISDGSNQGLTGYQYRPYCCNDQYQPEIVAGNIGAFNFDPVSAFTSIVTKAKKANWSIMIHANGDHAIDLTIEAFKMAYHNLQLKPTMQRDRIEHASLLNDDNLSDMQKFGLSPSFLIGHVGYWGHVFRNTIFGAERSDHLDRCQSALNQGMRISLHSDNSVTPLGPLRMMEQSITRIMERANDRACTEVLNSAERISRFDALKAVTYDAAWQCHMDKWIGSLEVGKCADFVILEQSPLTYGLDKGALGAKGMRNIKVLETWMGGCQTYSC